MFSKVEMDLLSNLKIVPKIEIRFFTNSEIIKHTRKKNIFNYFKLSLVKETIPINSRTFDFIKENKNEITENQIVLLDEMLNTPQWSNLRKPIDNEKINNHYSRLTKLLKNLSETYNKKIVICIHPKDDINIKKKYFQGFDVVQHKTRENIFKSFLVLFFESSAIMDAFMLNKKVATIFSKIMDQNQIDFGMNYCNEAGVIAIDIDKNLNFEKNDFLQQLEKAKKNYSNYINKYIAPDDDNLGYKKIIKILNERFFCNL